MTQTRTCVFSRSVGFICVAAIIDWRVPATTKVAAEAAKVHVFYFLYQIVSCFYIMCSMDEILILLENTRVQ